LESRRVLHHFKPLPPPAASIKAFRTHLVLGVPLCRIESVTSRYSGGESLVEMNLLRASEAATFGRPTRLVLLIIIVSQILVDRIMVYVSQ